MRPFSEVECCAKCGSTNTQWTVEGSRSGWFADVECLDCGHSVSFDSAQRVGRLTGGET